MRHKILHKSLFAVQQRKFTYPKRLNLNSKHTKFKKAQNDHLLFLILTLFIFRCHYISFPFWSLEHDIENIFWTYYEFKHKSQGRFCMNNVMQGDDVAMLEFLQQRCFPDGGKRSSFFFLQSNFLQCNDLFRQA